MTRPARPAAEFKHAPVLPAVALQSTGLAATGSVLLFRRAETAGRLNLLGALERELILLGVVFAVGAIVAVAARRRLRDGLTLLLGAVSAAAGVALMAWTIELRLFVVGGLLVAVGAAPAVAIHRPLLAAKTEPESTYRSFAWYWAAVAAGLGLPLGLRILSDISEANLLWICFAVMLAAAFGLVPHHQLDDKAHAGESVSGGTDQPWIRRSYLAAVGLGLALVAGGEPAVEVLVTTWQRSARQTAAVLGVGALAAVATGAIGPWYHQLHRLRGSSRADAIGIQLIVAGTMFALGALSFTYIGLIVCWAVAGSAIALAVMGLDTAVLTSVPANVRRPLAVGHLLALIVGASIGLALLTVLPESLSGQWRLALLVAPLAGVGAYVRRGADSSRTAAVTTAGAEDAHVPRRVADSNADDKPPSILSVQKLDVGYGPVQVLFEVDFEVRHAQVVALLGTNGAGKSTLLRAISGLEPTLGGRVLYAGLDITTTRPTWRVGMGLHHIVGGESVVGTLTVDENLRLFAYGIDDPLNDPRNDALHDPLRAAYNAFPQLRDRHDQQARTLSGGERQMLALAKALIVKPQLLLIDEFSLGLAPVVIAQLVPAVREIARRGAAIVLVEQSVNIALSVADYAYVIEKGRIGYHGTTDELRARPDLLRSAYLEGLSAALGR